MAPHLENRSLDHDIMALNARAWGISFGLLFGLGLFLATVILVLKGGPNPGRHLSLLSQFFPGYRISFGGSIIGFVYAFVVGWGTGRVIGGVYNRLIMS